VRRINRYEWPTVIILSFLFRRVSRFMCCNSPKEGVREKAWIRPYSSFLRLAMWTGQLSRYSDWLRFGWSGDRSPVRARFSAPVQTGPGAYPANFTMGTGSFPGGKERPRRDADPSPPSSAVGHERVELYLCSPYGPYGLYRVSVFVQRCTLPFLLLYSYLAQIWNSFEGRSLNFSEHSCYVMHQQFTIQQL
jgi:hypothetical protein